VRSYRTPVSISSTQLSDSISTERVIDACRTRYHPQVQQPSQHLPRVELVGLATTPERGGSGQSQNSDNHVKRTLELGLPSNQARGCGETNRFDHLALKLISACELSTQRQPLSYD
jgi:hypothetical protein